MIAITIDADACPVKQEIYRVAERHARKGTALKVFARQQQPALIAVPAASWPDLFRPSTSLPCSPLPATDRFSQRPLRTWMPATSAGMTRTKSEHRTNRPILDSHRV